MVDSLPLLRAKRGHFKAAITRLEKYVDDSVAFASASAADLEARKDRLVSTFKDYETINVEISVLDPEDGEDIEVVESQYYKLHAKLSGSLNKCSVSKNTEDSCNESVEVSKSKLPNIEISTFDGKDFTQFKPFMDLFNAVIDSNKSISQIQKLFYLRKYLKDDALAVIVNLPVINESYPEALTLLKKRFDNKIRLISNHINHLLDLTPMHNGTASSIMAFISEVQQQMYALKNLEQPTKQWDMLLISILSHKLDSYTCRAYHLDREDPDKLHTMEEFISYLERRAVALEDSPALKNYTYDSSRGKSNSYKVTNTATKDINKQESPKDEKVGNLCNQPTMGDVLLPTIKVRLTDIHGQEVYVKALLDTGSQACMIEQNLVNMLNLPQLKTNTKILGICNNSNKLDKNTNIVLQSGNNVELPICCNIVDTITSKLPQKHIDMSKITLPEGVKLADPEFNVPSVIQLLLGADVYFKIIQAGQVDLNNGLVLQNTLFGHVVGGSLSFICPQVQTSINMVNNFLMQDTHENLTKVMNKFWPQWQNL